jgi:hypothetical protein
MQLAQVLLPSLGQPWPHFTQRPSATQRRARRLRELAIVAMQLGHRIRPRARLLPHEQSPDAM